MLRLTLLIISYILGSIPFGFIVVYCRKKTDIRKLGSGNIGATNVTRILGKQWGILVFGLDFLKGALAPLLSARLAPDAGSLIIVLSAICVVCGHNWPVFLKFKGGKGVSTSLGAMAGICVAFPEALAVLVISLAAWIGIFLIFRIVSLASILSAFCFLIFSFVFSLPFEFRILALVLCVLIVIRHKSNIKNLMNKKESRF
jgi:glycerol-3-phosphate acyltransferase PlsY